LLLVNIDSNSPLAAVGSMALVQAPGTIVLVARTSASGFAALSSICTHQTCTITGYSGATFVCPCHGSQFDSTGRVVSGPAPAALRQFATVFSNNVLTISA
jgi:cytochrome b6-f complex iron-sulfur subunit